ncbi:MAG: T9SS type A sorting domain-containing protein [Candidatus Cloacimonetes bacterium]|nr:T9SS type A sorting domain-containing protein [Candidatus Cloacimonadota bacterium]MDY0230003.1 T9SS type A sorting domain-containing protein [Candidatus Cloacimonadaceae bacterium]
MKKFLLLSLCLLIGLAFAKPMIPDNVNRPLDSPLHGYSQRQDRIPPTYTFSRTPVSILESYYDYMIGSYNSLPLRVIPTAQNGGYFLTFHGKRTPTSTRRTFYAHLSAAGDIWNINEISIITNSEGYPTMAVDPISGKPMYAWHANADTDPELEVEFASDAFMFNISGLFNEIEVVMNNPLNILLDGLVASSNNEFIWPTLQIGPSPIAGKRRAYVSARNSVSHHVSTDPCENMLLAYADFNADMLESGIPLQWSYSTIPELDQWNHSQGDWRRPNYALSTDNLGNVYYAGYHTSRGANNLPLAEPDLDIFVCPNYGAGTWTRVAASGNIPSWNPPASPGGPAYFDVTGDIHWGISNSSHLNAVSSGAGKLIFPLLYAVTTNEGSYFPAFQTVKAALYDTATHQFAIRDIYPQKHPDDSYNQVYTPWDLQAPWGVPEYYVGIDGLQYLQPKQIWPFPHWDDALHLDVMAFHYSNVKLSEVNAEGMMVAVWQDAMRARLYNLYPDLYPELAAYVDTPEIYISTSSDRGENWSEPIVLNKVETPALTNLKPMWVYPADKVKRTGTSPMGNPIGKIGLMFYNDYTWGANAISPPAHTVNDGGQVMFAELEIVFPQLSPVPNDPFGTPLVLSSSMTVMAGVMVDGEMAASGDVVAAYANIAGVPPQLRGKGTVQVNNGIAGCLLQVFTEDNDEAIFFKVWQASTNQVLDVPETLSSQVNGTVGTWPDDLFWLHANSGMQQSIGLQSGWNTLSLNVHPDNMAISSIFGDILANVQMIKSPQGIYEPDNPYNSLTELSDGLGYYVRVSESCTLMAEGSQIDLSIPIALQTGWNLIAYTPHNAMSVDSAVASIANNLIQLKGMEGIYEPNNPYSTLTSLSPGKAYWVKLNGAADLIYPLGDRFAHVELAAKSTLPSPVIKSNSQSVLIALDSPASPQDILMAYVGDELRGIAELIWVDGRLGTLLQIFCETAGEQVEFRLQSLAQGSTRSLYPGLQTQPGSIVGDFSAGEYFHLSGSQGDVPELCTSLGRAYPNPFNKGTNIALNVGKDAGELKVEIFNLRGQKIKTLISGVPDTGALNLWWDTLDEDGRPMASGVYFCRLHSGKTKQNVKLMLVK